MTENNKTLEKNAIFFRVFMMQKIDLNGFVTITHFVLVIKTRDIIEDICFRLWFVIRYDYLLSLMVHPIKVIFRLNLLCSFGYSYSLPLKRAILN